MKKRTISVLLAMVMLLCCMPMTASAAELTGNALKQTNVYAGSQFDGIDSFVITNPLGIANLNVNDPSADFSFWHFVDTSKQAQYAVITFKDADGNLVEWTIEPCQNSQHYAVVTPSGWMLMDGTSFSGASGNFVLSHSGRHIQDGRVRATVNVEKFYNEITPHKYFERDVDQYYERDVDQYFERDMDAYFLRDVDQYYERDVDEYYERDIDEYYERNIDLFYERDVDKYLERDIDEYYERNVDTYYVRPVDEYYERLVDEYYERDVDEFFARDVEKVYSRPVYEIYVRDSQDYYVPVFQRKINSMSGTLVTRLEYSSNTTRAVPVNGGAFKNGHTYVAVDVAAASRDGGVWYTIADSSKNNGKKTPANYNKPIDYKYNVQIRDGKLAISFDEDFVSASVGAYVVSKVKDFPGNAPKHYEGGVTVDLPKDCGNVVYLYTHFARVEWYADGGQYNFLEWRYRDTQLSDYYLRDTQYGDYELQDTNYSEYELVDTKFGEYQLVKIETGEYGAPEILKGEYALIRTDKGDYELVDTVEGEYALVDTVKGKYELVDTVEGEYELVDTVEGVYGLVDTRKGEYELVNTVNGEYELINVEAGEYELVATIPGSYRLVRTAEGEYELVREWSESRRVNVEYTGGLTLTVNGEAKPLNEVIHLTPGVYTFVLSSDCGAFEPITREVTIVPGDNGTVDFGTITLQMEDAVLDVVEEHADRAPTEHHTDLAPTLHYADRDAANHYDDREAILHETDREARKHYADRETTVHETDREATVHEADREAIVHESDREPMRHYVDREAVIHESDLDAVQHHCDIIRKHHADRAAVRHDADREAAEKFLDQEAIAQFVEEPVKLPDIYLGNETDPFHEFAIRLG